LNFERSNRKIKKKRIMYFGFSNETLELILSNQENSKIPILEVVENILKSK
jgi:hypothetical protein